MKRKSARPWLVPVLILAAMTLAGLAFWRPWQKAGSPSNPGQPTKPAVATVPLSEARKLEAQARALIDDDPLAVRENYHTAYELCERAVALSPDDGEIWATMARAHCVLISNYNESSDRQVALARSQAERAMRLAPQSIESGLAMAYFEGLNNAGLAAVRQRLLGLREKAPTDRRILQELVRMEEDEKNPNADASRRWAEQANALPGGDAKALVNLAWVYWGLNQYPELEATLARALAIQPTSGAYHLKLMVLTVHGSLTGDQTAARAWLQQIPPAILREDRVAMIANQTLYFARQSEAALKVLAGIPREILEEGRYFAPRGYLAGEALLMAGKPRAAEVEFRAALKVIEERLALDASNSRLVFSKGRILARLGDRDGAAHLFETARELGITSAMNMESLMLEGRNDDVIKAADALMVRSRSRWPAMLGNLKANPLYDPLRNDPRFQQILARGMAWMEEMYHPAPAAQSTPALASGLPARTELAERAPAQPLVDQKTEVRDQNTDGSRPIDQKSVAVLAFANLSDDKGNEYFSDGISEELLNVLAKVPKLKVAARTSSFYFKGQNVPIPEIAQKLGVAYVVEGSVRKAGSKVRITAQLIKAADGYHVWSETYDRDLTDIFAVQDEIAKNILGVVKGSLLGDAELPHATTTKIEAYTLYLQAQGFFAKRGDAGLREAIRLYEAALAIDPVYVPALVGLAQARVVLPNYAYLSGETARAVTAGAMEAARRALELDPQNAGAHAVIGWEMFQYEWRWGDGVAAVLRARDLAPNDPWIWNCLGDYYRYVGDFPQALSTKQREWELDPLSPNSHWDLSYVNLVAGRYDEAIRWAHLAAAMAPHNVDSYMPEILAAGRSGRFELMRRALATARQNVPEGQGMLQLLEAYGAILEKKPAEARRLLDLSVKQVEADSALPAYVGYCFLLLGDIDPAVQWLQRGYDRQDPTMVWNEVIDLDVIAANPRTRAILELPKLKELYELRQRNARAGLSKL